MEYLQYIKNPDVKYVGIIVLNLVISGIPSIPYKSSDRDLNLPEVLNLVISGIPSILESGKPFKSFLVLVLNLVISGIPSIHSKKYKCNWFKLNKVLNLVISGIPSILLL